MTRSNQVLLVAGMLAILLPPVVADADQASAPRSQYKANQQVVEENREAIVAANLPLTDAEAERFWPVYRAYRKTMSKLERQMFDIVMEYASMYNAGSVTDADGTRLMEAALDLDRKRMEEREKVWAKVSELLPGAKAARYMQIENRIDAVRKAEFVKEIPLAEPQP